MTFTELLAAVYEETGYQSSPAAAVVTRIKRCLNEGVRAILSEPGMARLADSDSPATFATVAATARYVVPESVAIIRHMTERTNDRALLPMSLSEYRRLMPDPSAHSGTPTHYVPIGRVAVATQPSDASEIFVDSTAAGDTNTAYIEGIITGGYMRTASVSMTGTTAVTLSASIEFIEITDFYLSAAAVGTVTLHEDSGAGTELARITLGALRPRYYGFYLYPTPSAAVTYYVDYRREVVELVNNTDEPPLPTDLHPMLIAYTVAREFELKGDQDRFLIAKSRYQTWMNKLKYQTQALADDIPVMGRARRGENSRLGGFYPADHWS
jgi:hypothetical protein